MREERVDALIGFGVAVEKFFAIIFFRHGGVRENLNRAR